MVEKNDKDKNEDENYLIDSNGHLKIKLDSATLGINDDLAMLNNMQGNLIDSCMLRYDGLNTNFLDHSIVDSNKLLDLNIFMGEENAGISSLSLDTINDAMFKIEDNCSFLNTSAVVSGNTPRKLCQM